MATPRVVLDTNGLVSVLLFRKGRLSALRKAWHNRITPAEFLASL